VLQQLVKWGTSTTIAVLAHSTTLGVVGRGVGICLARTSDSGIWRGLLQPEDHMDHLPLLNSTSSRS